MLLNEMTDQAFVDLLDLVISNGPERISRKTQVDLRTFRNGLCGLPLEVCEGWQPFDNDAFTELFSQSPFMAKLHIEAKRRFDLRQKGG